MEKDDSPRKVSKITASFNHKESESEDLINKKLSRKDFTITQIIGKGSYAKVCLAEYKNKKYALKVIDKKFIEKIEKVHEVHIEKQILSMLDHPRIVKLHSTFQDQKNLYFVLDYCSNKDFSEFLRSQGTISQELSQFYAAEIVSALEYLRNQGISHRDLKPENIILDENMMIKLIDFSTSTKKGFIFDRKKKCFVQKKIKNSNESTKILEFVKNNNSSGNSNNNNNNNSVKQSIETQYSLVGTAEYVSPEALNSDLSATSEYYGADLWALGCIIYRFFEGETPFKECSEIKIFDKILNHEKISFTDSTPPEAQDIIIQLLNPIAEKRIGFDNIDKLKNHVFFSGIDFNNINKLPPPNESIIQLMTSKRNLKNCSSLSEFVHRSTVSIDVTTILEAIAEQNNSKENVEQLNIVNINDNYIPVDDKNISIKKENYSSKYLLGFANYNQNQETSNLENDKSRLYTTPNSNQSSNQKRQKKSNNFEISCKKIRRFSDETLVLECKHNN